MKPRSIKIIQTNRETGQVRKAELCSRYLLLMSDFICRKKTPGAILDALLWGDEIITNSYTYRLAT